MPQKPFKFFIPPPPAKPADIDLDRPSLPPVELSPLQKRAGAGLDMSVEALLGFLGMPVHDTKAKRFGEFASSMISLKGAAAMMPGFYSRLTKAMETLPNLVHPSKALSVAAALSSKEEIAHRGLAEFLAGFGNQKVSKEAILKHLEQHPPPTVTAETVKSPKFEGYKLPGGEEYQETLLKLPEDRGAKGPLPFNSSHWDQPNVLAHSRSTQRDLASGDPGKLIEEVQSDWHQQGKAEGYKGIRDTPDLKQLQATVRDAATRTENMAGQLYGAIGDSHTAARVVEVTRARGLSHGRAALRESLKDSPEAVEALENYAMAIADHHQAIRTFNAESQGFSNKVPDAPFKESWPDLVLKQQTLEAAKDPASSWVGTTSAQIQNERYGLHTVVSKLEWTPTAGSHNSGVLTAYGHNGNILRNEAMTADQLPGFVGREASESLISQRILEGEDLFLKGRKGMNQFYDQLIPSRLQKLVGPFGGKVEKGRLAASGGTESAPYVAWPGEHAEILDAGRQNTGVDTSIPHERIASVYPRATTLAQVNEQQPQIDALIKLIEEQAKRFPTAGPEVWFARLTPEMKKAILEKGFPLMSLLGLVGMKPMASHEPQR